MKPKQRKSITELFLEGRPIDAALRKAGQEAMRRHKAAGQPIVTWRNGKVVEISASAIPPTAPRKRRK